MQIIRHNTAAELLSRAKPWLENAEAENNLILGIAGFFGSHPGQPRVQPYFLTVEDSENIVGAALMTPPRRLLMTRMPDSAVIALADYMSPGGAQLPGGSVRETAREFSLKGGARKQE